MKNHRTIRFLTGIVIAAVLALIVWPPVPQARAGDPPKPIAAVEAAAPAPVIPELTADDMAGLQNGIDWINKAAQIQSQVDLAQQAATAERDRAKAIMLAEQMRILAKHKLDPDQYKIDVVKTRGPDGKGLQRDEWRIVPIAPPPAPPK